MRALFNEYRSTIPAVSAREIDLYEQYFAILKNWNETLALVSKKSIDLSFANHFVDSIFISDFAKRFLKSGQVYDLGTGAGFPGIVFAIRNPEIKVRLYEKLLKKQTFLAALLKELDLKNAELRGAMSEEKHRGVLLARAVMPPPELFPFVSQKLEAGSVLILNVGSLAETPTAPAGFEKLEEERYSLPQNRGDRRVIAYRYVPHGTK